MIKSCLNLKHTDIYYISVLHSFIRFIVLNNTLTTFLDFTNRACLRKITLHLQQNAIETLWQIFHITFTRTLYFILCANKHAVGWDMWVDSIYNLLLLSLQISNDIILHHFTICIYNECRKGIRDQYP